MAISQAIGNFYDNVGVIKSNILGQLRKLNTWFDTAIYIDGAIYTSIDSFTPPSFEREVVLLRDPSLPMPFGWYKGEVGDSNFKGKLTLLEDDYIILRQYFKYFNTDSLTGTQVKNLSDESIHNRIKYAENSSDITTTPDILNNSITVAVLVSPFAGSKINIEGMSIPGLRDLVNNGLSYTKLKIWGGGIILKENGPIFKENSGKYVVELELLFTGDMIGYETLLI